MKKQKATKVKVVQLTPKEMTWDEVHYVLQRLHFWSNLFYTEARGWADTGPKPLAELIRGLTEDRFIDVHDDFAERMERMILQQHDPVELWRYSMGLQNHKFGLRRKLMALYPEREKELEWYGAGRDIDHGATREPNA